MAALEERGLPPDPHEGRSRPPAQPWCADVCSLGLFSEAAAASTVYHVFLLPASPGLAAAPARGPFPSPPPLRLPPAAPRYSSPSPGRRWPAARPARGPPGFPGTPRGSFPSRPPRRASPLSPSYSPPIPRFPQVQATPQYPRTPPGARVPSPPPFRRAPVRPRYAPATPGYLGESAHLTPRTPENPGTFRYFTPPSRVSSPPPFRRAPVRPRYAQATPGYLGESAHLTPRTPENPGSFRYFTPPSRVSSPPPFRRAPVRLPYAPATPGYLGESAHLTPRTPENPGTFRYFTPRSRVPSPPSFRRAPVRPRYAPATPGYLGESAHLTLENSGTFRYFTPPSRVSSPPPLRRAPMRPRYFPATPGYLGESAHLTPRTPENSGTFRYFTPTSRVPSPPPLRRAHLRPRYTPTTPRFIPHGGQQTQSTPSDSRPSSCTGGVSPTSPATPRSLQESAQQTQGRPCNLEGPPGPSPRSSPAPSGSIRTTPLSSGYCSVIPRLQRKLARHTRAACGDSQTPVRASPVPLISTPPGPRDSPVSLSCSPATPRSSREPDQETQATASGDSQVLYVTAGSPSSPAVLGDASVSPSHSPDTPRSQRDSAQQTQGTPSSSQSSPGASSESSVSFYVTFNNCPMSPSHSPPSPRFQESARYSPESPGNSQGSPHSPVSPVSSPLAHGDFAESPSYSTFSRSPGETGRLTQETPMHRYTSLSPFPMSDLLPRVLRDSPRPPGSHTTRRFVPESAHHPRETPHDSQIAPDGSPLPVTCIVTAPACALVAIPSSSASVGQPRGGQATVPCDPVSCSSLHVSDQSHRLTCRRDPLSFRPHPRACPSSCYCHSVARRRGTYNGQHHHPGRCPPQWGRVMSPPANARMHPGAFMPADHTASDRAGMTRPAWW